MGRKVGEESKPFSPLFGEIFEEPPSRSLREKYFNSEIIALAWPRWYEL